MQSIPFTIPNISHGLLKAEGVVKLDNESLIIEYRTKDGIIGAFKGEVEQYNLPVSKLEEVRLKRRLFSYYLIIRASSMAVLDDIHGVDGGVLSLKISRSYRKQADRLVSEVSILLSEIQLNSLD